MTDLTVMKLGGSLTESDAARRLLRAIAARRPRRLLIVPGGGEFADAVRAAQARVGVSDRAAHHMALLAMHMSAVMLVDLAPGFVTAEGPADFEAAWGHALTPIWLPAPMVLAAPEVPASWDITSDSLAAWLAAEVGANRLVLVKSCRVPAVDAADPVALSAAGVVDPALTGFVDRARFRFLAVSGVEGALAALT
jgi:aspartokinase-like uncharacterized kinase